MKLLKIIDKQGFTVFVDATRIVAIQDHAFGCDVYISDHGRKIHVTTKEVAQEVYDRLERLLQI